MVAGSFAVAGRQGKREMSDIAPIGSEHQPIPVNPIRNRRIQRVAPKAAPRRAEPLARVRAVEEPPDKQKRDPEERFYRLSAETRRALLDLDPEHPLNGPHPTD